MILTDPLEGLRDSISRQQNGSSVRENLVAPPGCVERSNGWRGGDGGGVKRSGDKEERRDKGR